QLPAHLDALPPDRLDTSSSSRCLTSQSETPPAAHRRCAGVRTPAAGCRPRCHSLRRSSLSLQSPRARTERGRRWPNGPGMLLLALGAQKEAGVTADEELEDVTVNAPNDD
ncbi:unnamed protein product, partial [Urochloa humidicola]